MLLASVAPACAQYNPALNSIAIKGTTFTASGCGAASLTGGGSAGSFTVTTTGACSVTVTMGTGVTAAADGWSCWVNDETTANLMRETGSTTGGATLAGTTVTGDTIVFGCMAY